MDIEEARALPIGAWVVYCPTHGPREDGKIVRCGESYVHVLYAGDTTPKATAPGDLALGCPSAYRTPHIPGCSMWHHQGGDYDRDCDACMEMAGQEQGK